ncbi:MAG: hypothetical protein RJA10_4762 [Pseudomonadota bacterium]|jgi:hypothetical protein
MGCLMNATIRIRRCSFGLLLAGTALSASAAEGLTVPASAAGWTGWQVRLEGVDQPVQRLAPLGGDNSSRVALLGDYDLGDFGLALPRTAGRFRATSGVLFGLQHPAAPRQPGMGLDTPPPMAPYIGLGYTGWFTKSGLSFSADVGVTADYPGGAWRLGRAWLGSQGSDATLRELRVQPRLRLGMQYSY